MPNINDLYPSKFLKAYDLKGSTPTVTIARVTVEQVRSKTKVDTKIALFFVGKTKGLLLNKTMALSVQSIAKSAQTEAWTGVALTLYATTATFGQDVHDVIRIKAPEQKGIPSTHISERKPPTLPRVFTDELEIDLQDAGGRR